VTSPRVSIVVPCHNGGRYIDGLLASLAAQTFRDFEIIIVDDGSTDPATRAKLDELEPAIRVVHQENRYLPGARNRGFREAWAPFVLPLDCDDTLEPSYLAETVPILDSAPPDVGFVFTYGRVIEGIEGVFPRHFNRFDQLFLNYVPYCMLIRRSAWEVSGGYDETMRDGQEDWEFNIRLARCGFRGIALPKPLSVYRVRADGMLLSRTARMHGTIWRYIRTKHADLYRIGALMALWRETRTAPARISAPIAAGLLGAARLLPDAWFNGLFYRVLVGARARRVVRGELRAGPVRASTPEAR
jgi:glycosyltransferase involved in cell wall biosynthesis